jgi:hypothetical protein
VQSVRTTTVRFGVLVLLTTAACRDPHGPCEETAQCLEREVCYLGWCRTSCNTLDQCQGGEACRQGMCLPAGMLPADAGAVDRAAADRAADDATLDDAVRADAPAAHDAGPEAGGEDRGGADAGEADAVAADASARDAAEPLDGQAAPDGSAALDGQSALDHQGSPDAADVLDGSAGDLDGSGDSATPSDATALDDGPAAGEAGIPDGSVGDVDLGCSLASVYWGQPATCLGPYTCRYDDEKDQASCSALAEPRLEPYARCIAPEQCPPGTVCATMVDGPRCMPACSALHPQCPAGPWDAGAVCTYDLDVDSGTRLCEYSHVCDPRDAGGCDLGACFAVPPINVCAAVVDAGSAGAICADWRDCAPTYSCHLARCRKLCDPLSANPCADAGTCQNLDASVYSVCLPGTGDAGSGLDVDLGWDGGGAPEAGGDDAGGTSDAIE